jgi:hypothetical protein
MKMAGLPNPCLTRFGADSGGGDGGDAAFDAPASNVSQLNQGISSLRKSRKRPSKQIDQLTTSVRQISKAADVKLDDLKKATDDKLADLKDRKRGAADTIGWVIGSLGVIVALIARVLGVIHFSH